MMNVKMKMVRNLKKNLRNKDMVRKSYWANDNYGNRLGQTGK